MDTDRTTANSNISFEARKLLTQRIGEGGGAANASRYNFSKNWKIKCQFPCNFELNDDEELIHMTNGTDTGRVVVDRFVLWVHKLTPRDSMYDRFVNSFLKETEFKYMREMC